MQPVSWEVTSVPSTSRVWGQGVTVHLGAESTRSCQLTGVQLALDTHMEAGVGTPEFSLMSGCMGPLGAYPACSWKPGYGWRSGERALGVWDRPAGSSAPMPEFTHTVQAVCYPATSLGTS